MADTKPQWTPGHAAGQYCTDSPCEECDALSDAAPELYAALQACDDAGLFDRDDAISTSARAALAKARGEK